jgi:nitrate reductase cytochrome c-type subunit
MKHTAILLSLALVVSCSSSGPDEAAAPPAQPPAPEAVATIPDSEIGLATGTAFEQPPQAPIVFNAVDPGESELSARPNAEFPPVIPHSIQDLDPITLSENPCLDCHNADVAEDMGAVAVPASHRMDLRNSPGEFGDEVTGARLVCTSCHVEMTE